MTDEQAEQEENGKKREPSDAISQRDKGKWAEIVKAVNSPLALFVVPALCFESATVAALFSDLTTGYKFLAFLIGQVFTLIELGLASYITIRYARHWSPEMAKALEKSEEAKLEAEKAKEIIGSTAIQTAIQDEIEKYFEKQNQASDQKRE